MKKFTLKLGIPQNYIFFIRILISSLTEYCAEFFGVIDHEDDRRY